MSAENTFGTWSDFQCPHCGAEDGLETDGDVLRCFFCGVEE